MKKVALILILIIVSTLAMPIALAVIEIPSITAQAGPAGSASINGTFLVSNLETYNDASYTVDVLMLTLNGTATELPFTESYNPGQDTIIAKETDGLFNYNVGVTGEGWVTVSSSVMGFYYENATLGFASNTSEQSSMVIVDSALPEFSSAILPILLSIILFGIVRRKVE